MNICNALCFLFLWVYFCSVHRVGESGKNILSGRQGKSPMLDQLYSVAFAYDFFLLIETFSLKYIEERVLLCSLP